MSRSGIALMLSLLWVSTCSHTHEVEQPAEKKADEPAAPKKRASRDSEVKRPAFEGRPELSTNAAGLMKAGGPMHIQRALAKAGYYRGAFNGRLDDATAAALRRFQADHDLARTGAPDRETVEALGLDPADIWGRDRGQTRDDVPRS